MGQSEEQHVEEYAEIEEKYLNIYPRQNVYHAKNKSIDCTLLYGRAPLVYLLYAIPFTKVNQV